MKASEGGAVVDPAQTVDLGALTKNLKSEDGAWLEVVHPATLKPIGLRLKLAGCDTAAYQAARKRVQDRDIQLVERRGKLDLNAEELDRRSVEIIAEVTLDWEWTSADWNGKKLELSRQNVVMVYQEATWIFEQADRFVRDRANFLQRSSGS